MAGRGEHHGARAGGGEVRPLLACTLTLPGVASQVVLPLWPGVESITEPAREEVEDALEAVRDNVDTVLEDAEERMDALRDRFGGRPH